MVLRARFARFPASATAISICVPRDRREYVLKLIDLHAGAEATDCQIRVLRHLAEQDAALPVPRVLATQAGTDVGRIEAARGGYAVCLMGYLPGQLLSQRPPAAHLLHDLGQTLARLDRALRGFFHPALAQRLAWDVRRLPELIEFAPCIEAVDLRTSVERVSAALRERMPALRALRSQAIHGDCHGHNLLVDAQAGAISGILDFGDMIHAPMVLEPAVAMSELLTDELAPIDALSRLLHGYAQRQPLEAAEVEVLYDLIAARHAVTILVHAWRERHDAGGARVLERSAANAARSLDLLLQAGREPLTGMWRDAAGSARAGAVAQGGVDRPARAADLPRRRRLMGAGAELFYEQPLHIVRGSGVWLYDPQGAAYLDVYNNVAHVGHTHPDGGAGDPEADRDLGHSHPLPARGHSRVCRAAHRDHARPSRCLHIRQFRQRSE